MSVGSETRSINRDKLASSVIHGRSVWVDNVRGLAILLVVVGHVIQFGSHGNFDFFSNWTFVGIYAFHMPLFAAVSGYLACRTFERRGKTSILKDRVRSLVVPFLAWTALFGTAVAIVTKKWTTAGEAAGGFLAQFLFPASTLWFLIFLFFSFVIAAAALYAERWIGILSLPISVLFVFVIPLNDALSIGQLRWLYPFFLAGLLANRYKRWLGRHESVIVCVSTVIFFAALLWFWQRDYSVYLSGGRLIGEDLVESIMIWTYRFVLGGTGVIAATGVVRFVSKRVPMRLLQALGRASLGIYCLQTYFMVLLAHLPAPDSRSYFLLYVPLVACSVLVCTYLGTHYVLERHRVLRIFLLGAR
ncbi:acyltransferase family protein [Cryobacterium gelidum]|uniref:acyltransferase family protein n=1 Tax=Cryobacterium gelidum TaxID=1259164 RepID=UPI00141B806D|nr:acyltransferase family protein [Cryobacterium gelidum]